MCDHMLGTLSKWLRLLGFDVIYPGPVPDSEIKDIAAQEHRMVLTRDKELASTTKVQALCVKSDVLEEQLRFVLSELDLIVNDPMSRCSLCNSVVDRVDKSSVEGKVPEGVFDRQEDFWFCSECDKYYWQGSHWDKIAKTIEELDMS
ncbi:MAG: Mut7-C RNAse domain-containing protein [Thermoplasmata archaeon]